MINFIEETKKHYILINVKGDFINNFIFKLSQTDIKAKKINYLNKKNIEILIRKDKYKELKTRFPNFKFRIKKNLGIFKFKPFFKKNRVFLFAIILGLITLYFGSQIILKVEVIHSNKTIRNLIFNELKSVGIKKYSLKKSYKKISIIKEKIIDKYPDKIEWLEIENIGMTYVVHIEERIIKKEKEIINKYCHIVANRSAILTKIIYSKGEKVKMIDNYVNEGDIVISGQIKLNDSIKDNVCASGLVYGEVWYTVNVNVPFTYEEKIYTGKKRINLRYETEYTKHSIFRSKFKKYDIKDKKKIITIFGVSFILEQELEYNSTIKKHSFQEAINYGLKLAKEKIKIKLKDDEKVMKEKVLKKTVINSTIELEVFIAVEERIGKQQSYEINIDEEMS